MDVNVMTANVIQHAPQKLKHHPAKTSVLALASALAANDTQSINDEP